jgi:CHAT domain-containing protein
VIRTDREVRDRVPDIDSLTAPRVLDVATARRELLRPDEALIAYCPHRSRLQVFVLTKEAFSAHTVMYDAERLQQEVEAFRRAVESKTPVAAPGKRLYDLLLAPVEKALEGKHVVYIVGDGPLRVLPLEALATSDSESDPQYVLSSRPYDIVYEHSVAVLSALNTSRVQAAAQREAARPVAARRPLLLFANPTYRPPSLTEIFGPAPCGQRLTYLKGTAEETASLLDLFRLDASDPGVNVGSRAQPKVLRQLPTNQFRFVHIAMHGLLCAGNGPNGWTEPALAFSPEGNETASLLHLEDVYSLRFDADMMTLSACETALGEEINGEGVLGLTRAFLFSGADTVISTLWSVDDRATATLMIALYRDLLSRNSAAIEPRRSKVAALQSAKRRLAAGTTNGGPAGSDQRQPYFWAPFVIYGLAGQPG